METDDLLCSRNARSQKVEKGAASCPPCSQNAHDRNVLVRCAQSRATLAAPLKRSRKRELSLDARTLGERQTATLICGNRERKRSSRTPTLVLSYRNVRSQKGLV